jgi:hypothetical protein
MTPQADTRIRRARLVRVAAIGLVVLAAAGRPSPAAAQGSAVAPPQRLTIPYLASATRPADLDFSAAECDIDATGDQMECRFRQVFLTIASVDPAMCVITTNGYDRAFRRETAVRWVSEDPPVGACGIVETTTLEDGGGTHWTMTIRTSATERADQPDCRAAGKAPEIYDWRTVKRPLPCSSIQPGAIER